MTDEAARTGVKELAEFLGMPLSTVTHNLLTDMKREGIVIEWMEGRPARKRIKWWPSLVIRWMAVRQRQKWAAEHPEK